MSDKKITLDPKDRERLKEIMRQKEAALDAAELSDDELAAQEKAVEESLRKLAQRMSPPSKLEQEAETAAWKRLQEKMEGPELADQKEITPEAKVIPLFRRPNFSPLWVGGLTVAALALLMLLPQKGQIHEDSSEDLLVTKGAGEAAAVNCELDVLGKGGSSFKLSSDGLNFLGKSGSAFELSVVCEQSGYFHVDALGAETKVLHNIAVKAGEKVIIKPESFEFQLQGKQGWNFTALLTRDSLPSDLLIPHTATVGEALGSTVVLWIDSVMVRELGQ